jgi:hypothetical protein
MYQVLASFYHLEGHTKGRASPPRPHIFHAPHPHTRTRTLHGGKFCARRHRYKGRASGAVAGVGTQMGKPAYLPPLQAAVAGGGGGGGGDGAELPPGMGSSSDYGSGGNGPTVGMLNGSGGSGGGSTARGSGQDDDSSEHEHDVEAQLVLEGGAGGGGDNDDDDDAAKGGPGTGQMSKWSKYYTVGLLTLTSMVGLYKLNPGVWYQPFKKKCDFLWFQAFAFKLNLYRYSMFLYADQNLISPNLSAVAEDFGFDEREKDLKLGGWLQLAFFVVGSPASLIIGWLSDKVPRTRLFFITVLIGEGPCLATYWVKTYWQLFIVRALTGVAVGGCLPLLFSLCGDIFPAEERNYVASFLTIATGAGIAVGQIMARLHKLENSVAPCSF